MMHDCNLIIIDVNTNKREEKRVIYDLKIDFHDKA